MEKRELSNCYCRRFKGFKGTVPLTVTLLLYIASTESMSSVDAFAPISLSSPSYFWNRHLPFAKKPDFRQVSLPRKPANNNGDLYNDLRRKYGRRKTAHKSTSLNSSRGFGLLPRFLVSMQEQQQAAAAVAARQSSADISGNSAVAYATQPTGIYTAPWFTKKRSFSELIGLYTIGAALLLSIVYTLASTVGTSIITEDSGGRFMFVPEAAGEVGSTIMDAAIPMTATDVVTTAVGEATAGVAAAFSSLILSLFITNLMYDYPSPSSDADSLSASTNVEANGMDNMSLDQQMMEQEFELQNRDLSRKAVANGDFFIAQAATVPWLATTMGLPPGLATLGSFLLAVVPAEMVNIVARRRIEKDRIMLERILEREEETRRELELPFPLNLVYPLPPEVLAAAVRHKMREEEKKILQNLPVVRESLGVEVVEDLIKWLGYGVLSTDFAGSLMYDGLPLFPGVESAVFGIIAGLSAQVYADVFSAFFGLGGELRQEEVLSRSPVKWFAIYFLEIVSAAVLFGVYEFAQIPAKAVVSAVLSGGADSCSGSQDYDLCLETYLAYNPPGASPEAQLRSLTTTVASLLNKYTPDSFDAMSAFF
ncbi:hypothetical protein ACA910_001728 [Epithemia clementina (nom. ined.)]